MLKSHRKNVRRKEAEGSFYDGSRFQTYKKVYSHFIRLRRNPERIPYFSSSRHGGRHVMLWIL